MTPGRKIWFCKGCEKIHWTDPGSKTCEVCSRQSYTEGTFLLPSELDRGRRDPMTTEKLGVQVCAIDNFDGNMVTFKMPDGARWGAGEYAIIPTDELDSMVAAAEARGVDRVLQKLRDYGGDEYVERMTALKDISSTEKG